MGLNVVAEVDIEEALGEAEKELDAGVTEAVGFVRILGGATTELFNDDRMLELGPLETLVTSDGETVTEVFTDRMLELGPLETLVTSDGETVTEVFTDRMLELDPLDTLVISDGETVTELFTDRMPEVDPLDTLLISDGETVTVTDVTPDVRVSATVSST